MQIVLLAVFGVLGTLLRYGLQGWVQNQAGATFPTGTLAVNLLGCLLIGGLNRLALEHLWFPPEWRIALTIGFLGGFTTFSAFGYETFRMLEEGEWARASLYVGISVIGGLIAVVAGMKVAELF
ncbi:MAG: fluoride efflux transporter CrcB [Acidobacteria bacterium]|nr:fluoride efflux transporter CrcB [Acidobacteriota bacterium]